MNCGKVKKIMIVDDERSILLGLSYALRTQGVEVVTCNEIEQAEAALETTAFDLVIADIRMSGVNGVEGLELLSYIKHRFATEVMIMTGYGTEEIKAEAYRLGAVHFFSKPLDIPDLISRVSALGIPVRAQQ